MLCQIVWHLELWRSALSVKRVSWFIGQLVYSDILSVNIHMENVHTASKLLGIECDSVKNREFRQYLHVAGILILYSYIAADMVTIVLAV